MRRAWATKRNELDLIGNQVVESVYSEDYYEHELPDESIIEKAYKQLERSFDPEYGGFGNAPKFPTPHNLLFLLRYWYAAKEEKALEMVEKTLDSMYKGGIYDHIGFGFCRYSTDRKWLVPHFEKMLYDNALLSMVYAEAFQATKKDQYKNAAVEIYKYIERDMTSPGGAFYSAEDADSEGVEGLFYLWTPGEIISVLGDNDGKRFCDMLDITPSGNFEGYSIPNLISSREIDHDFIDKCRSRLFDIREKRIHPFKDDKILTSWNALMAASFAVGGRILKDSHLTETAKKAVSFIKTRLTREDGRLLARYRDGEADIPAFLEDYAYLQWAFIELYQSTYEPEYLTDAVSINVEINRLFLDNEKGGFFLYGNDAEKLITRPKDAYDGAMPSGNSVIAMNLVRLSRITGDLGFSNSYESLIRAFSGQISATPLGYVHMLTSYLFYSRPSEHVILVSDEPEKFALPFINVIQDSFRPFTTSVLYGKKYSKLEGIIPHIEDYAANGSKTLAYICRNFTCNEPVSDLNKFIQLMS